MGYLGFGVGQGIVLSHFLDFKLLWLDYMNRVLSFKSINE